MLILYNNRILQPRYIFLNIQWLTWQKIQAPLAQWYKSTLTLAYNLHICSPTQGCGTFNYMTKLLLSKISNRLTNLTVLGPWHLQDSFVYHTKKVNWSLSAWKFHCLNLFSPENQDRYSAFYTSKKEKAYLRVIKTHLP